jgi:hypothetical protein
VKKPHKRFYWVLFQVSKEVGFAKKRAFKKFLSNSKEENKLKILQFLSNLKEKKILVVIHVKKIRTND